MVLNSDRAADVNGSGSISVSDTVPFKNETFLLLLSHMMGYHSFSIKLPIIHKACYSFQSFWHIFF